ncbi:MAG: helix-turn-helix domain-containing protein [Acidimicrobiales bacterium]|nr:helix-turn-helix domain-containing protein [Acidimicrobiales bacterium]
MGTQALDLVLIGHRLRHLRKEAGLTLAVLGERIGRPASYLSQVENGRIEPKIGVLGELAEVLGCATADFFDPQPPSRRSALQMELDRHQKGPWRSTLELPELRASARIDDDVLEVIVGLYRVLPDVDVSRSGLANLEAGDRARLANIALRTEMRKQDNYFEEIERLAAEDLALAGYGGEGPPTEKDMADLAAHHGFTVERVKGMPRTARSVTDTRRRVIYIPQRDDLSVRAARSVVLQTLGHFALEHAETTDFESYLRQRIESNYYAAAVLIPERAAVDFLSSAKDDHDLSIEDLKERYYVSYEMAAHRFTNLATRHLGLLVHFIRTDPEGTITKAYENNGLRFPTDLDGGLEGARIGRQWGARQAWDGSDLLHYQHTVTSAGEYWCVTYVENATERTPYAVTIGCQAIDAGFFRGGDTLRSVNAAGEEDHAEPDLMRRWEGVAWPSASERSFVLTALPSAASEFSPFPGIDLLDVYRFLERQSGSANL